MLPLDAGKVQDEAAGRQVGALEAWVVAPYSHQPGVDRGVELLPESWRRPWRRPGRRREFAALLLPLVATEKVFSVVLPSSDAGFVALVLPLVDNGEGVLRYAGQF